MRNKVKSFILIFFICVLCYVLYLKTLDNIESNRLFKGVCDNVVTEFVSNNKLQNQISYSKLAISFPGSFYIKSNEYQGDNAKLRERYISGSYLAILPYSSVDEFNAVNPNSCSAIKATNVNECYQFGETYSPYDDYICAYLKFKIRYFDQNGNVKILDEYASDNSWKKKIKGDNDKLIAFPKDTVAILKLNNKRHYTKKGEAKDWRIDEWQSRVNRVDGD